MRRTKLADGVTIGWGKAESVHSGDAFVNDIASGNLLLEIVFHGHAWIRLSKAQKKRLLAVIAEELPTRNT
jgi:hypothetical protein